MKCEDVQELISEYAEDRLPEMTKRRVDQHLAGCASCTSDYQFWAESDSWMKVEREQYASVSTARSIVDAVMARILSEEKWAIPFGRKVFTLTARMRRIGASAAVILLMLCAFSLYSEASISDQAMLPESGVVAMVPPDSDVEVKDDAVKTAGVETVEPMGVDEIASPPLNSGMDYTTDDQTLGDGKPNFGLILGFFGILVTVISLSWMSRVKDRS
ncbi:zf-HC2 domain-containing protein [Brevibacillus migulae]|uniref:zf-HC2 domain-containing protein n=1 Tax=Brevibacillus migulae TaxID=1644114 RepID=UPI00106EE8B0|nr:zf-HC2 domain-containing protein [Brevibacillus migulae]